MRVLVVEDEFAIAKVVRRALERQGHEVALASTGMEGLELLRAWRPDIVLLDLVLPDVEGRTVARDARSWSDVPIIITSALGEESDRVAGLSLGADDYLVKPYSIPELVARIEAVTRRARGGATPAPVMTGDEISFDPDQQLVFRRGEPIDLTKTELSILRILIEHRGRVVNRAVITRAVWGRGVDDGRNVLDVHLSSLRRKLGRSSAGALYIETVRGVGFRFVDGSVRPTS